MEIDEEVVGFDLQKRSISHNTHLLNNKSDTEFSSIDVSVVDEIINGEKPIISLQLNNENGENTIITAQLNNENGEKEEAINGDNDMSDNQNGNGGIMLYPTKIEGTNGFSVGQNGADAVSSPESNGEDEQVHVRSNGTSFSKGTDAAIGLKYVESLLDESSSRVNGKFADITATELNKVNEILKSGQNEVSPEAAEYDVEGVIMKQETHDLYCPNCNSCITKRVILRRRKRKIQEISHGEEIISSDPGQIPTVSVGDHDHIVEPSPQDGIPQEKEVLEPAVGALTCFSCFSIFIPTGKGFLFWKSASKPSIVHQQESSVDIPHQAQPSLSTQAAAVNSSEDEETGKSFPMWILTCCEPYKHERETAQQGESDKPRSHEPQPPVTPPLDSPHPQAEDENKPELLTTPQLDSPHPQAVDEDKPELPTTPPLDSPHPQSADDDKPELPTTPPVNSSHLRRIDDGHPIETPVDATEDEGKTFPLWILTCCQSSRNQTKPVGKADTPLLSETESPETHDADTSVQLKHDAAKTSPPNPNRDISSDTLSPSELKPTVTHDPERTFPLWFLTCCQPGHKVEQTGNPDMPSSPDAQSDIAPDADNLLPSEPKVPGTPEADRPSPSDAKSDTNTDKDTLSSPESKFPETPDTDLDAQNQQTMHMPGQQISPKLTVIPPDVSEPVPEIKVKLVITPGERPKLSLTENPDDTPRITGAEQDLEAQAEPLLPSDEHPSHGVSGLDVIKAIVYGGLLEIIASLSIISSAAGGDATTLNIVALGLANVFGGLIVLFHNLRDLKNNRRHYEEQLGKPRHFLLHATIAIMSYLVFGLMAPVVYGFSFRKSDEKNFKLITLAAASLVCVIFLSIGKAYVRRSSAKDYIKTILYYASIGVLVSGLGYVSGQLINDALKELGVFDSKSPVNMSVLETGVVNAALSSY